MAGLDSIQAATIGLTRFPWWTGRVVGSRSVTHCRQSIDLARQMHAIDSRS